jgi:hypothetical protein
MPLAPQSFQILTPQQANPFAYGFRQGADIGDIFSQSLLRQLQARQIGQKLPYEVQALQQQNQERQPYAQNAGQWYNADLQKQLAASQLQRSQAAQAQSEAAINTTKNSDPTLYLTPSEVAQKAFMGYPQGYGSSQIQQYLQQQQQQQQNGGNQSADQSQDNNQGWSQTSQNPDEPTGTNINANLPSNGISRQVAVATDPSAQAQLDTNKAIATNVGTQTVQDHQKKIQQLTADALAANKLINIAQSAKEAYKAAPALEKGAWLGNIDPKYFLGLGSKATDVDNEVSKLAQGTEAINKHFSNYRLQTILTSKPARGQSEEAFYSGIDELTSQLKRVGETQAAYRYAGRQKLNPDEQDLAVTQWQQDNPPFDSVTRQPNKNAVPFNKWLTKDKINQIRSGDFSTQINNEPGVATTAQSNAQAAASATPAGLSETDIQHTAQKYGIPRDEVLRRLKARGKI